MAELGEQGQAVAVAVAAVFFLGGLGLGWWAHRWHARLERHRQKLQCAINEWEKGRESKGD